VSSSVFDAPHHEPRYGYGTVRANGGNLEQVNVVEATYLPEAQSAMVQKTVVSMEFLTWMEKNCFSIQKPAGKLINASGGRLGRPNLHAREIAGSAGIGNTVRGHFYWLDMTPRMQHWWRFSLPWDPEKMPGVKNGKGGNRENNMRLAAVSQVVQ